MTEDELIRWLKGRAEGLGGQRIGDDAAILPPGGPWVATVDTQIEGVHFFPGLGADRIAARLLAVNLSDLAAMGAEPAYGFLALSSPASFDHQAFFEAFLEGCRQYGLELSGGDLSSQPTVTAALTLIGRQWPGGRFVERGGARIGHGLWIGGAVGESALGFELLRQRSDRFQERLDFPGISAGARETARRSVERHLLPRPQLELGRWLAGQEEGGAIDLSDGLAKDLHRMCAAAGVAARLEVDALVEPVGWSELRPMVRKSWLELALGGGEDYVLCFTLPEGLEPPDSFGARRVGEIRKGRGVVGRYEGEERVIEPTGWDHLESRDLTYPDR